MNTLRDFSGEWEDPHRTARNTVEHNNQRNNQALADAWMALRGPNGSWWDVAWVYDTRTGQVIVCFWAPLESLDD